jgi:hypothetical protein
LHCTQLSPPGDVPWRPAGTGHAAGAYAHILLVGLKLD